MFKFLPHPIFLLIGLIITTSCGGEMGGGLTSDPSGEGELTIVGNPAPSKYTITGTLTETAKQYSDNDTCAPKDGEFTVTAVDTEGLETDAEAIKWGEKFSISVNSGGYRIQIKQNGKEIGDLYNPSSHPMAGLFGIINLESTNIDIGNMTYAGFCNYNADTIPDMRDSDYNFNGFADGFEGFSMEMPCTFCIESTVPYGSGILFVKTMPSNPSKYRGTAIFRLNSPVASADHTAFQILDESGAVVVPELDPAQVQLFTDESNQGIVQAHLPNLDLSQKFTLKVAKEAFTSTTGVKTGQEVSVIFRTVPAL